MSYVRYTPEMIAWLEENIQGSKRKELYDKFREHFGVDFTDNAIDGKITALKLQTGNHHVWTPEDTEKVRELRSSGLTWKQVGDKVGVTEHAVKTYARKIGLCTEVRDPFTPEEDAWLAENVPGHKWKWIAEEFEKTFGKQKKISALKSRCRAKYIGAFTLGGRTGGHKGDPGWNLKPDGSESTLLSGYSYVKIDGEWVPKQKAVYERAFGKIPDNMFVVFLNGDKTDYSLKNLYATDRAIHAQMCSNGWYSEDAEITLAAIKLCELNRAIRTVQKGKDG